MKITLLNDNQHLLNKKMVAPVINAGQLGLGSSWPETSRPGSTQPDNISAWSYFAYFFIRDASMNCVLYIKCSAKVGSIYIAGLSNLFQSTGPTSLR